MQLALKGRSYLLSDVVSDSYSTACRVRFNETIRRVNGRIQHPALDVGESNALSRALGIPHNTDWDLNNPWPSQPRTYRSVTCFEVIEHVQNPLLLMQNMRAHMEEGGRMFLTTPVAWFMGKGEHHFHEFTREDLVSVLQLAGFEVVHLERMRAYTWAWKYTGIRPIIRLLRDRLFGQCWYVEAKAV